MRYFNIDNTIMESQHSFLKDLYEVVREDYNIQDSMIRLNHTYNKTNNLEILTEGFNDIIENIVKFFKSLLTKFKEFFKNIAMYMNSHIMELGKFVDKYKDKLNTLDVSFTIRGYKFTIPESNCPNLDPYQNMVSDYNSSISDVKSLKKDEISKEKNEFLSDNNLDKLRGKILDVNKAIPEDEFTKEIRAYFRDNSEEEIDLNITKSTISSIISSSKDLTKAKDQALKSQVQIESLLNKTIAFFDKKITTTYKGDNKVMYTKSINTSDNKFSTEDNQDQGHTDSVEKNVNELLSLKYNQSKQIATITTTIATEKTKALNDNIALFRKILREAIFNQKTTEKEDK